MSESSKTTFYRLLSKDQLDKRILIPSLQRSYAQGRNTDEATEIRHKLLSDILEALKNNTRISLDNVYGAEYENGLYVLLDGQQRLTTLFLLHHYLFVMDGQTDKTDFLKYANSSSEACRFTYHTRLSSKDFCVYLIGKDFCTAVKEHDSNYKRKFKTDKPAPNAVSTVLKNDMKFQWSWHNDPTIQSMLVMLDKIHELFYPEKSRFRDFIDILLTTDKISFFTQPLRDTIPADELYIKMNARGLRLTPFENFKSSLYGFLEDQKKDICKNIDSTWLNAFWEVLDKKTNDIDIALLLDSNILNVLKICIECFYCEKVTMKLRFLDDLKDKDKEDSIEDAFKYINGEVYDRKDSDKYFSFLGLLEKKILQEPSSKEDRTRLAKIITCVMTWICENKDRIKKHNADDTAAILMKRVIAGETLSYAQVLHFYLIVIYELEFGKIKDAAQWNEQWYRILDNLILYSDIDKLPLFLRAFDAIRRLYQNKICDLNQVLHAEDNDETKSALKNGFISAIVREEELKSRLRRNSELWKDTIDEAEKVPFFNGQIFFIFEALIFAKVDDEDSFEARYLSQKQNVDAERFKNIRDFFLNGDAIELCRIFNQLKDIISGINEEHGTRSAVGVSLRKAMLAEALTGGGNYPFDGFILPAEWKRIMRLDFSKNETSKSEKSGYPQTYRALLRKALKKHLQAGSFDLSMQELYAKSSGDLNSVSQMLRIFAKEINWMDAGLYVSSARYDKDNANSRILLLGGQGKRLDKNYQELHTLLLSKKLSDIDIVTTDNHGCLTINVPGSEEKWILLEYCDGKIRACCGSKDTPYHCDLSWDDEQPEFSLEPEKIDKIKEVVKKLQSQAGNPVS